jgi:uracil phosphoribosyltransferase
LLPNFLFDIEDDLFTDFGNISNYHFIKKPQQSRNFTTIDSKHSDEVDFLKKITKELISVLSDEWLEESEFLNEIIRINSPSITIQYQLDKYPFETLYNLVVGVNIMSAAFAEH